MIEIKFDINPPLERLEYAIHVIEKEVLNDLTEFWNKWARPVVIQEIADIFVTEGRGTWASLSPAYKKWKERAYPGRTILRLKNLYFHAATIKGRKGNIFEADKDKMVWGVDLDVFEAVTGAPYPIFLEKGAMRMGKKGYVILPARPVFYLAEISQILQNNLVVAMKDYLNKMVTKTLKQHFK